MYYKVLELAGQNLAPKVTGMLIDLESLQIEEILHILESKQQLEKMVNEAKIVLDQAGYKFN